MTEHAWRSSTGLVEAEAHREYAIMSAATARVTLPGTDLSVSRVCLGTMQFAGSEELGKEDVTWGKTNQQTVNETVVAALDAGINFFDCAEAYGGRQAERALGEAFEACGRRQEAVIATKFGRHAPLWETDDPSGGQVVYDGLAVEGALRLSLEALRIETIDLYQVHWPGNIGIVGDEAACREAGTWDTVCSAVAALERARSDGKIRFWGVCNFGVNDMAALKAAGGASAVSNQLPYSPLWRQIEHEIIGVCDAQGLAVLSYSSLQQGLLSGRVRSADDLPEGRRRTRLFAPYRSSKSRHGGPGMEEDIFAPGGALEKLHAATEVHGLSVPELTLGYLLSMKGVACVLVGASTPEQAARNAQLPTLSAAALEDVARATDALKEGVHTLYGSCVDQYAAESRIH